MLKRVASVALSVLTVISMINIGAVSASCDEDVSVSAHAAILMCANNGQVIFEKNSEEKLAMASTTKIMTAVLALEAASAEDQVVEFKSEMIAEGSSMYLKVGDKIKLTGLVGGLLAASGNDAANAIAYSLAGSKEDFAKQMNTRAQLLGMNNTNFATPSGLDADDHYSTAHDMAVLMCYAMENEKFREITGQKDVMVEFEEAEYKVSSYHNHNRLLSLYEYCIGGKTGFTEKAGRCLVTCAQKDGIELVAVTLNAPDDWNDHIALFNYGFEKLSLNEADDTNINLDLPVVGGMCDSVMVTSKSKFSYVSDKSDDDIKAVYELPRFVYAGIKAGEPVGRVVYYHDDEYLGEVKLIALKEVKYKKEEKSFFKNLIDTIKSTFGL